LVAHDPPGPTARSPHGSSKGYGVRCMRGRFWWGREGGRLWSIKTPACPEKSGIMAVEQVPTRAALTGTAPGSVEKGGQAHRHAYPWSACLHRSLAACPPSDARADGRRRSSAVTPRPVCCCRASMRLAASAFVSVSSIGSWASSHSVWR
jgi:hypothetical protein